MFVAFVLLLGSSSLFNLASNTANLLTILPSLFSPSSLILLIVEFMCFGSDWPSSQTFHFSEWRHRGFCLLPPNEVEDAEGLDKEHAGEDVPGGKRTKRTFNKDMANEMEMSAEKCATQIP